MTAPGSRVSATGSSAPRLPAPPPSAPAPSVSPPTAPNSRLTRFSQYESGIYDGCSYDSMDLDHVVVLVGYGTDEKLGDYWLVRNSWSPTFGEQGYIRLKRDPVDATVCGVDTTPEDGTGCAGAETQYPCGQCGVVFDVSYPTGAFIV